MLVTYTSAFHEIARRCMQDDAEFGGRLHPRRLGCSRKEFAETCSNSTQVINRSRLAECHQVCTADRKHYLDIHKCLPDHVKSSLSTHSNDKAPSDPLGFFASAYAFLCAEVLTYRAIHTLALIHTQAPEPHS